MMPDRAALRGELELGRQSADRIPGPRYVQGHRAAKKMVGRQWAEHQVRIGDGGLCPAAIAGRPGIGASADRADAQNAPGVGEGDRAAPRADGVDIEHWDAQGIAAHAGLRADVGLVVDQRDVGRGPAHVKTDDLMITSLGGDVLRADYTTGWTGENAAHCAPTRLDGANTPTVGLHDAQALASQRFLETGKVAVHDRRDVGIDRCRARALELTELG